jgi:predicted permease
MSWYDVTRDLRYAVRTLWREPGFFATAVLILGLGIGATTAIFSVIHTLLLRPLAFHDPGRLVWIANTGKSGSLSSVTSRTSNLRDYRRLNQSFEGLTGYDAFFDYNSYVLTGEGNPERLAGVGVAPNFLEVLGVQPQIGRNFVSEESVWNGRRAVLLTHEFWTKRFGSDPEIVGRSITLNDQPTAVVGVLPPSFDFASVFSPGSHIDFLTVFPICDETDRQGSTLAIIGRLGPEVSISEAQAELDLINRQLKEAEPDRWGLGAAVSGLHEKVTGRFRSALVVLACGVGVVLMIACANISNLLLARAASRRKEIAVRSALGAGRSQLIRQMLTESLLLSGCGAAVGVVIAFAVTRAVATTSATKIPLLQAVGVDGTALGFTMIVALSTGLLFGIFPALQISAGNGNSALNDSSRGSSQGRGGTRIREALVVSEVALACVLLVGAGLLLKSFLTLMEVDLGFRPDKAAVWRIEIGQRYSDFAERNAYYERLVRRIETVPGIESLGLTDALPLGRNRSWGVRAKGQVYEKGKAPGALPRIVDSNYLETMGIPLLAGRHFTPHDTDDKQLVMIINEAMAERLWPGDDPIGRSVLLWNGEWRVVGMVGNVRHSSLEEEAGNEMYLPMTQMWDWRNLELVVRTSKAPEAIAPDMRAALRSVDSALPVSQFQTLGQIVDRAVSPRRFILFLIGAFAVTALLLASLGIYGVVAYSVSQQTHEIGIRMALGSSAARVQRRIVAKTLTLTVAGIMLGTVGAYALTRLMASLLYGVSPTDPMTFAAMVVVLTSMSVVAGYLPAYRAARIDPVSVLREA